MPNAVDRDTVGEEVTILGLGYISLSSIQARHIKVGVVGKNCFDAVLVTEFVDNLANFIEGSHSSLTICKTNIVFRYLARVVCRGHQFFFKLEDIVAYERVGCIHIAVTVNNCDAHIIGKSIIGVVGGFNVNNEVQVLFDFLYNSFHLFLLFYHSEQTSLSSRYIYYNIFLRVCQGVFQKFLKNFFKAVGSNHPYAIVGIEPNLHSQR